MRDYKKLHTEDPWESMFYVIKTHSFGGIELILTLNLKSMCLNFGILIKGSTNESGRKPN